MKKISLFIILLLIVVLCIGCVRNANTELRLYFFGDGSIDRTFAQKLEKCQRYTTPIKYYRDWGVPSTKNKVKIIGIDRDNRCIIRSYKADYFSPLWKKTYEYHLPEYVLPYFSDIYKTAFNEKYGNEVNATEKLHLFCNKYKDFCINADTVDEKIIHPDNMYDLSVYIWSLSNKSAIYNIYLYYKYDFFDKQVWIDRSLNKKKRR